MSQTMKPATAASKLGIYLPAAPEEFQRSAITRGELDRLRADPPAWLSELRRNGRSPGRWSRRSWACRGRGWPAPASPTRWTPSIGALIADPPEWLVRERESYRTVAAEKARLKALARGD